jgi:hypothetical protein
MHKHFKKRLAAGIAALTGVVGLVPVQAADVTYDFTTDPSSVLNIVGNGVNTAPWVGTGGNPGGFLALTYPVNSLYTAVVFPNADPGKVVTGFTFTCDLRVGNGSNNAGRPADGFSISFARDGDPVLVAPEDQAGFAVAGGPENGTKTGIAVSFDTWSGNTLPDGADVEGIIVRVDNVTVNRTPLATRNGACADITSLQTGPHDAEYWAGGGDAFAEGAWDTLCWQPVSVQVTSDAKLTVKWKGNTILDAFQTTYFPSAGQIVLASRTGGANENTHFDNLRLITEAQTVSAVPGAPPNLAAVAGARRVGLSWDAATVAGNPNAQVAYEVERNGVVIAPLLTVRTYEDRGVAPGQTYTYKVRGKNIAGLVGPDSTVAATTGTETDGVGFLKAEQWTGIGGTAVDAGTGDPHFADPPDRVRYVNGFSFGETSNFGDTWGENHLVKISGVFTAPKAGNYRFYIASDDASALFVNTAGAAIPDGVSTTPVAVESGCCGGFEPVAADGTVPEVTSEPIALAAGAKYGIAFFVKEGGGGDWGRVAIKDETDPTPVATLPTLRGSVLSGPVDTVGASITLNTVPGNTTVNANQQLTLTAAATGSSPYGGDYGNAIVYQWFDNGVPILGANGPTLSWANIPAALNGHVFTVGAGVAGAAAVSAPFTLTVTPDTTVPTITRVAGSATFNSVTFYFSEPVTDPSALAVGNYTVTGLTLSNPVRVNGSTIRFTSTTQTENTVYNVTVNGVQDLGGNPSAYTGTLTSYQFKTNLVDYKTWQNQTGAFSTFLDDGSGVTGVKDLAPTTVELRTSYVANTADVYDNYFGQLTGFFIPPANGNYVFFMASDDHGEIYLSTDASPANKKKIAEEPSWSARGNWVGNDVDNNAATRGVLADGTRSNRSDQYTGTEWPTGATITLTGGTRYYLEVLFKEGGGGDHGGATYKLASAADPADFSASTLTGAVVGTYADPGLLPPLIVSGPGHQTINAGETATFTVTAESAVPMTYQWYKNNKAVAGATSASLVIANAGVINVGDYRVTVSNANGSISTGDNDSRLILKGAFVVEAEDYNFDNGQTLAAANTMPLASSLFQGKDGQQGVDLSITESTADGGANGNSLRQGWIDNGTVIPAPDTANADVIADGNGFRGDFTLTQNYKIGWGDNGEWYQYTRSFPEGNYAAVLIQSRDGRAVDGYSKTLELVTGDPTKPDAATTIIGRATHDGSGGWSSNDHIPFLKDGAPAGSNNPNDLATFALGANTTFRVRLAGGDGDLDGYLFYKVDVVEGPTVSAGVDGTGAVVITYTGTLQGSDNAAGPFTPVAGATGGSFKPDTTNPGAKFYRSSN